MRNPLQASRAPNQPIAPGVYTQSYLNQLQNAFRLYFNQLDGITSKILGRAGGKFIEFPHISASDSTDQYALGDDTPTKVLWNSLEVSNGFTLNMDGTATPDQTGVYKIDYSLQFANTANESYDVFVWLEVNGGTLVPNSSSKFTLPARKANNEPSFIVAYSHVTFNVQAQDAIALYWATDKAYVDDPLTDGVYMEAIAAIDTPYERPANPSAIGTITFVSNLIE